MADLSKYAIPDANGIRWAEATSKNGVHYRHGFLNSDTPNLASAGHEASAITVKASDDDSDGVDVKWALGTSANFASAICHVTNYDFFATPHDLIYDYQLLFAVDGGWLRTFTDDLNTDFRCFTIANGSHYIQFSSSSTNPFICHVS